MLLIKVKGWLRKSCHDWAEQNRDKVKERVRETSDEEMKR